MPAVLRDKLSTEWCYLRPADDNSPLISLAPFARYGLCPTCGCNEIAIAEQVVLGQTPAQVRLRSVLTGHFVDVPLNYEDDRLNSLLQTFRESSSPPSPPPPPPPPSPGEPEPPPAEPEPSLTLLFLGASPRGMPDVEPEEEMHEIEEALELGFSRILRRIVPVPKIGARAEDLQKCLHDVAPTVLHVSAHGSVNGEVYFKGSDGGPIAVEPGDFAAAVKTLEQPPRVVVLCACYSALGVEELRSCAGCVVGMKVEIGAKAGLAFCRQVYRALATATP